MKSAKRHYLLASSRMSVVLWRPFNRTRFSSSVGAATGDQGISIGYTLVIHHSGAEAVTSHDGNNKFRPCRDFCVCVSLMCLPLSSLFTTFLFSQNHIVADV